MDDTERSSDPAKSMSGKQPKPSNPEAVCEKGAKMNRVQFEASQVMISEAQSNDILHMLQSLLPCAGEKHSVERRL